MISSRRSLTLPKTRQDRPRIGSFMLPISLQSTYLPPMSASYIRAEESEPCLPPTCPAINSQMAINSPCTCAMDSLSLSLGRHSPILPLIASSCNGRMADDERPPRAMPTIFPKSLNLNAKIPTEKNLCKESQRSPTLKGKRRISCLGKCLLCFILNVVFLFAIFFFIFIGKFTSHFNMTNTKEKQSASFFTPLSALLGNNSSASNTQSSVINSKNNAEFPFEKKPLSIYDVYPPSLNDPEDDDSNSYNSFDDNDKILEWNPLQFLTEQRKIYDDELFLKDGPLAPLPKSIIPRHYDLDLDFTSIDRTALYPQIIGNVTFHLESFGDPENYEIVLHAAANIFIIRVSLTNIDNHLIDIKSVYRDTEKDLVRIYIGEHLASSFYYLNIEFQTRICTPESAGVHCFYSRRNEDGPETLEGFSTKFEPCFARTFFPGWDDPSVKSTFNVSISHFINATILTNTAPLKKPNLLPDDEENGHVDSAKKDFMKMITVTKYERTPIMPLYLLAFATGSFSPIDLRASANLPLKIWCDQDDALGMHFAANFSPTMFGRIQQDFGVKYPLSKLDFFVTPNFPVGGMENWGLIVFHSSTIRVIPQFKEIDVYELSSSSEASEFSAINSREQQRRQSSNMMAVEHVIEQYRVEKAITHELIHQWFGNLVTMASWRNLWLSEGFATYFVYDLLNSQRPHLTEHEYYMRLIELLQKQSIRSDNYNNFPLVYTPMSIAALHRMFDGVNLYTKGAIVVKMIKDLIGSHEFRASITRYLRQNAFKSVTTENIWTAFPKFADHGTNTLPLVDAIHPWLHNIGVPEVIVERNYRESTIKLTQAPFNQNNWLFYLHTSFEDSMRKKEKSAKMPFGYFEMKTQSSRKQKRTPKNRRKLKKSTHHKKLRCNANFIEQKAEKLVHEQNCEHLRPIKVKNIEQQQWKAKVFGVNASYEKDIVMPIPQHSMRDPINSQESDELKAKTPKTRNILFTRSSSNSKYDHQIWSIPFSYSFGSVKNAGGRILRQSWFSNKTLKFTDSGLKREMYLLANPHWIYPYKVNYDLDNWQLLIAQLRSNYIEIPVMSRMQLVVDAETYLSQSAVPHLYLNLLSYLSQETDLGVLLVGLDAIHRIVEMFAATDIFNLLLIHLIPAIEQIDQYLLSIGTWTETSDGEEKRMDVELASLWLLNPQRLTKIYQLRCLANLDSCQKARELANWKAYPTAVAAENYQQLIAICQHLFSSPVDQGELSLLTGLLKNYPVEPMDVPNSQEKFAENSSSVARLIIKDCVLDESLLHMSVQDILNTRNAGVYTSSVTGGYSIQYNRKFRELFWKGLAQKLSVHERQLLFAINTGKSNWIARVLLHSIRSLGELNLVEQIVLPHWPEPLLVHIKYLRRKFQWIEFEAAPKIKEYLLKNHRT